MLNKYLKYFVLNKRLCNHEDNTPHCLKTGF